MTASAGPARPTPVPRPRPTPTPVTRPFWDATLRHELLVQWCLDGDHAIFYPRAMCPSCWSSRLGWRTSDGKGTLASHTTIHRPGHPAFVDDAPYVVGLVDLQEGVRILATIDAPGERPVIGDPVEVGWEDHDGYSLPRFRIADPGGQP